MGSILLQASSQGRLATFRKRRVPPSVCGSWNGGGIPWTAAVCVAFASNWVMYQLGRMLATNSSSNNLGILFHLTHTPHRPVVVPVQQQQHQQQQQQPHELLAWQQSYGFFHDISDQDWVEFYQTPAREARHYRVSVADHKNPNEGVKFVAQWNFFNWDKYFNCPHLQKVGGLGGGPKWTCDVERLNRVVAERKAAAQEKSVENINQSHCLVYSIGSRGNYRWELGLFDILGGPVCEIHVFDFTNYEQPGLQQSKNIHFHQWGLGSSYSSDYRRRAIERGQPFVSFQEIQQRLGHENRTIDLFKIDCESCEWHTYKDWITAHLRQVLIETHELPLPHTKKQTDFGILPAMNASDFFDAFKDNGFALYSKEVNTQRGYGRSVEWSFIKLRPDFFGPVDTNAVGMKRF